MENKGEPLEGHRRALLGYGGGVLGALASNWVPDYLQVIAIALSIAAVIYGAWPRVVNFHGWLKSRVGARWLPIVWFFVATSIVGAAAFGKFCYDRFQYRLKYQVCRDHRVVSSPSGQFAFIKEIYLGLRLQNDYSFPIAIRVEQGSLSLNGKASTLKLRGEEVTIFPHTKNLFLTDSIEFNPPLSINSQPSGHMRYVLKYGRKGGPLDKRLVFEGDVDMTFDNGGWVDVLYYTVSDDSSAGMITDACSIREKANELASQV